MLTLLLLLIGGGAAAGGAAGGYWYARNGRLAKRLGMRQVARLRPALRPLPSRMIPPGPRGDVVRLRMRLRDAVAPTRQLVATPMGDAWLATDLDSLMGRAEEVAVTVDSQLALLEKEPNDAMIAGLLPRMEERVAAVLRSVFTVRELAMARVEGIVDRHIEQLAGDAEREAEMLRGTVSAYHELASPTRPALPPVDPETEPPPPPQPTTATGH